MASETDWKLCSKPLDPVSAELAGTAADTMVNDLALPDEQRDHQLGALISLDRERLAQRFGERDLSRVSNFEDACGS